MQTYERVEQVEKYIKDILMKSASFSIKKDDLNFGGSDDNNDNKNTHNTQGYFYFYDKENSSIKHFIYAKQNSQAGEKYNKNTIDSIKSLYKISTSKYKFDYKETIIDHFQYMGKEMFNLNESKDLELIEINENEEATSIEMEKEEKNLFPNKINEDQIKANKKESLIDKKNIKFKSKLTYKGEEQLVLQKMVIDELGISSFIKNDFTLDYEIYYNEKELIINIECPEGIKLSVKRKINKNKNTNYQVCIEIIGEKTEEKKKENVNYIKSKQFGKFYALIPFTGSNYYLGKGSEEEPRNGWKLFKFPLSKIEDEDE